jgi:CBS domain-containing protein
MGGTMRSPLTAIAFMLELTDDINVLPALLISCVAAHLVTVLMMKRSILTEKVARRGHHVIREYQISALHQVRVADVMDTKVVTVPATMPIEGLFSRLAQEDPVVASQHAWPVVDEGGRVLAVVTRGDLVRAMEREDFERCTALDVGTTSLVVTYGDELLEEAAMKMLDRDIGGLPVVSREDPTQLLGYLARKGILAGWFKVADDERRREPGWLSEGLKVVRGGLQRVRDRDP